jgi:hypothetical protein
MGSFKAQGARQKAESVITKNSKGYRIKIIIQVEGGEEMTDRVLTGWKEIAEFMGWSESKAKRKKDELLKAGVIFYLTAQLTSGRIENHDRTIHHPRNP